MRARLRTLGRFEFIVDDVALAPLPTLKARALLAYLALNDGSEIPRERLVELFWGEFEPARGREGLRTALSTIRRALRDAGSDPDGVIGADRTFVHFNFAVSADAKELEEHSRSNAESDWRAAVELYAGDFLDGNYETWAIEQREHYAALFEAALARLIREAADTKAARQLIARNPYDEDAYAVLLDGELQAQRLTSARELFARYLAAMAEAALEPSPALVARFGALRDERESAISLPFVARRSELVNLEHGFTELAAGRTYAAMIVGEPGIGKTALLKRASDRASNLGCESLAVAAVEDSGVAAVWGALYHRVTGTRLDQDAATAFDVPGLVASTIVRGLARSAILFVDDAHTLRGDALATLVELSRLARQSAFGLIVAMRPEGLVGVGALMEPYVGERIDLGPLAREDVDTALTLTLNEASAQLSEVLFARSGGHPLFLVSLLESLVRDKTLDRNRGRWRVTRDLSAHLELPRDLRASIEARLRAAGDDAAVVACALALEPSANAEELARALGYDEAIVLDALDRLLGFALIGEHPALSRFAFLHDVVREVAATLLNAGRRVALHREFARLYETDAAFEARSSMARHLQAAGAVVRAAHAHVQAARSAMDAYAFHDALQSCADGVLCLERLPSSREAHVLRAELNIIIAEAAVQTGAFDLAAGAVDDAVRAARAVGEGRVIARALVSRAALLAVLGDPNQRLADAVEARRLSIETSMVALEAKADVHISAAACAAGSFDDAVKFAVEGAARAAACNDRVVEYAAAESLLRAQISWWHFGDAGEQIARAVPIAEAASAAAYARLQCMTAWFYCSVERFDEANRLLAEADRLVGRLAERRDSAPPDPSHPIFLVRFTVHYVTGLVAVAEKRWGDALAAADRCLEVSLLSSVAAYRSAAAKLASRARLESGDASSTALFPELQTPSLLLFATDSPALWTAAFAACRRPERSARAVLRTALDDLEERANAMPLDCDCAFALLASVAEECGDGVIAARARSRSDRYHAARMAAAARHRSASPRVSSGSMSRPSA
ncbi:MAG: AAA family ATPase [Candidatus Tumulicola sp.]